MGKYVMKMPDVGEGVVEAEVVEWLVNPGDVVAEDQHIVDVMTDKATMEITSPVSGKVVAVYGDPGDMLAVGAELIEFSTETDSREAVSNQTIEAAFAEESPAVVLAAVESPGLVAASRTAVADKPPSEIEIALMETKTRREAPIRVEPVAVTAAGNRPLASPSVRRRAREAHVDLTQLSGTDRNGRIGHADLDRYIGGAQPVKLSDASMAQDGKREVKVIGLRRVIAQKVALSKRNIPHFSYIEEVDLTELESLRLYLNAQREEKQVKLTYLPFLMLALSRLLKDFPQCNGHFDDDAGVVTQYDAVHIGIATQTSMGLKVPVVKHAEALGLWELAEQVIRVSEGARNSTSSAEELTGSTITITSLGALGGLASTPVINHPEVAIIGVNKSMLRPVIKQDQVVSRLMMNLSSSFDHRVVDGYDAAQLIQSYKGMLEHPAAMFI